MALRKRTDSYWLKRANQRLTRSERISKAHMRELAKVYNEARRQTVESLKQIYAAYYKGQDGFDMQALRSIVPSGELKRFLDDMKKLGISTDLPDNYNARITRLRFINEQLAAQAHKVAMSERTIDSKALREVYTDSYYRAGYDVARGIGSTPSGFSTLDQRTVDKVMNARFEGRNFSTRVWKNSDILASKLKGELATAIATGQSIQKTAARFRDDFNVNQYYAERLIRTETNHFHNSAELEAYKEMGFEKFKFLATLDNRTSEICQEMDSKIFNVKDGLPGENIPPLHPNCRSTIVPYFKGYEPETRIYRDREGHNKFTYNIQYHEWRRKFAQEVYDGRFDKAKDNSALMHSRIHPILGGNDVLAELGFTKGRAMSHKTALNGTNPDFKTDPACKVNCQRCVPVYELRRRGYDVVAAPKPKYNFIYKAEEAFVDPKTGKFPSYRYRPKSEHRQIIAEMKKNYPDGARFAVSIRRARGAGHVFVAEKVNGKIVFSDPQANLNATSSHFRTAAKIGYFRMDNLPVNNNKLVLKSIIRGKK